MSDDPRNERRDANSQGSRATTRDKFNFETELGQRFAEMSPEGKKNIEVISRHGQDRLERETNDQKRSNKFRIAMEENRRLKELVRHPDLRLGDIKLDGQSEISHIENAAKETVSKREETYRENIRQEIQYSIEREMADDKNRREFGPNYDASRTDRDHDR